MKDHEGEQVDITYSAYIGRLEGKVAHLEQQIQEIENNRDQLVDDFDKVHAALYLAVRLLPFAEGDNADELHESVNAVLFEMENSGYRLKTRVLEDLRKYTDIPF